MFNTSIPNGPTTPLVAMGVSLQQFAGNLAQAIENNRSANVVMQALWTVMSVQGYNNQTFQKFANSAYIFVNAKLSEPNAGTDPNAVVATGMEMMCYACGAEQLAKNQMLLRGLDENARQHVQQYLNMIPQIEGYIAQYTTKTSGNFGGNMSGFGQQATTGFGFGTAANNSGFGLNTQPANANTGTRMPGSLSMATMPTVNIHETHSAGGAFGQITTAKQPTVETFSVRPGEIGNATSYSAAQETRVPGGAHPKSETGEVVYADIVKGSNVDYNDHKLVYPGSDVLGEKVIGNKTDFFGVLGMSVPLKASTRIPADEDAPVTTFDPLKPEQIVMYPEDDNVMYAFGAAHAIAIMQAKLMRANDVHFDRQAYMLTYYDMELIHSFPDATTAKISHNANPYYDLLSNARPMTATEFAATIRNVYKAEHGSINMNIARRMNIAMTKAVNELVFICLGVTEAGLNAIDSFASDYDDLMQTLTDGFPDKARQIEEIFTGEKALVGEAIRRCRNLHINTSPEQAAQISKFVDIDGLDLDGRVIYSMDKRVVVGIPYSTYDLGLVTKPGPNVIDNLKTTQLYCAVAQCFQHIGALKYEISTVELLTLDGGRYQVIADSDNRMFAITPMF